MGPALPCAELLLQLSRGNTSQGCQGPALLCPCHWGQFSQEGQLSLKQLSKGGTCAQATGASTPMALGGNEGYFLPPPASVCSFPLSLPFFFFSSLPVSLSLPVLLSPHPCLSSLLPFLSSEAHLCSPSPQKMEMKIKSPCRAKETTSRVNCPWLPWVGRAGQNAESLLTCSTSALSQSILLSSHP